MELQQIPQDLSLSGEARNSAAAGQVLKQIATNEDRMLVMVNYASQGMMQVRILTPINRRNPFIMIIFVNCASHCDSQGMMQVRFLICIN